ncbi:polysaccharide deacetylase family protein [Pseudarthrobacter sp. NamE5]|uniref:polysaccharide deacetylase family protein n=1 Tax=Pseudarthrobacter sp. NamE5 TaxID=2576839 RepID=UPI00110B29FC|nr:polysaccharide deacetylase family protein [Pseudarthrobacter sp. NamE5]TLM81689.1 hypothetical protein FDW84_17520 [Pseudarthrobacter sp. NamE5]
MISVFSRISGAIQWGCVRDVPRVKAKSPKSTSATAAVEDRGGAISSDAALAATSPSDAIGRRRLLTAGTAAAAGVGALSLFPAVPASATITAPARSAPTGKGAVVLSMDDAFMAMDTVRRFLDERGQKGTFFITPGLLNGHSKISEAHIVAMAQNGHEVGAHSLTHANLTSISPEQRSTEFEQPKFILEKITGVPVTSFAYPFGTASGGRNLATDVDLYLRYDRVFDTSQYNQAAIYPRYSQTPSLIRRTGVDGASHAQCLAMVREAAKRPVLASLYFHNLDTQFNPTTAQLIELLDLAKALGVELITASEAFGSHRMVANAGFEENSTDALPWRWFKSGSAQLEIVTERPQTGLAGNRSLHLYAPPSTYSRVAQAVEVVPGVTYTYSFRARAVQGSTWASHSAYGHCVPLDYGQSPIAGAEVRTKPVLAEHVAWTKYSVDFTAPVNCSTVLLGLVVDWPNNGGRVAFDHVWFGPKTMGDLG